MIAFTAQLTATESGAAWRARCRSVERLGYAGISIADHLGAQLGPLVAMGAAAAVTERVQLGFNVLANDFRHPLFLAKELATLDVMSDGRALAGLGAGWMAADYAHSGIPFDPPGARIDRLVEAVHILRGAWSGAPFSHHGRHYQVTAAECGPRPVQPGGPPILLGGGARRMLTTAGALADVVGIALDNRGGVAGAAPAGASATRARTEEKLRWIAEGAAGAGRPVPPVSVRVLGVAVTNTRARAAAELASALALDPDSILESPHVLVGTVDQIADDLRRRRAELGIERYVVSQSAVDDLAAVIVALAG